MRCSGLVRRVEMAECGMVEFMPTDFKVPFRAVERIRGEIKKPFHCMYLGNRAVHLSWEAHSFRARNLFPLFVKAVFIKKHDREILNGMSFYIPILSAAAYRDQTHKSIYDETEMAAPIQAMFYCLSAFVEHADLRRIDHASSGWFYAEFVSPSTLHSSLFYSNEITEMKRVSIPERLCNSAKFMNRHEQWHRL